MNIALRHPVRYVRALAPLVIPAIREVVRPSVEITEIPAPGLVACMQKLQLCSMGLMTGFGDNNHCHMPDEVTAGALMFICGRHIDEARALGVIEHELTLS